MTPDDLTYPKWGMRRTGKLPSIRSLKIGFRSAEGRRRSWLEQRKREWVACSYLRRPAFISPERRRERHGETLEYRRTCSRRSSVRAEWKTGRQRDGTGPSRWCRAIPFPWPAQGPSRQAAVVDDRSSFAAPRAASVILSPASIRAISSMRSTEASVTTRDVVTSLPAWFETAFSTRQ